MAVKIVVQKARQFDDFKNCVRELGLITGRDFQQVIEHEVTKILELAIGRTKKSDPGKVLRHHLRNKATRQRIDYRGPESISGRIIPESQRQRLIKAAAERRGRDGGSLLYMLPAGEKHRHPNWLWRELTKRRRASLEERLAKIGLSAKHWWQIGRILGLPVQAPQQVRNAKNDRPFTVNAKKEGRGNLFIIQGGNFSKLSVKHARGHQALGSAVRSRATTFNAALRDRAKGKVDAINKRYPSLMAA